MKIGIYTQFRRLQRPPGRASASPSASVCPGPDRESSRVQPGFHRIVSASGDCHRVAVGGRGLVEEAASGGHRFVRQVPTRVRPWFELATGWPEGIYFSVTQSVGGEATILDLGRSGLGLAVCLSDRGIAPLLPRSLVGWPSVASESLSPLDGLRLLDLEGVASATDGRQYRPVDCG